MARQRVFTNKELLDAAEQLLLERGYDGFHLKALSEKLHGARSTIYEYFANKEEIVAACMRRSMEKTVKACSMVNEEAPAKAIKELLILFVQQSGLHKLMMDLPRVELAATEKAKVDLAFVEEGHLRIREQLLRVFASAQQSGIIRNDVPYHVLASVFYHAVDTPNWMSIPVNQWADMLFTLWWEGGAAGVDRKSSCHSS